MNPKASKGTVVVEVYQGRLRLRWRHGSKRYTLAVGLPESKVNRQVAQQKATAIELDIASGNFDASLKKYKPHFSKRPNTTTALLFQSFMDHKSKTVTARTLEKYRSVFSHLNRFFAERTASEISSADAEKFVEYLRKQKLSPVACKTYLTLVRACWEWGVKQDLVELNPFAEDTVRIRVPPKQKPKPFSREEIGAIIQAFRSDRYYCHYADYVEFLFGTGCRTGEAIGLQWKHLSRDCSTVWIGESLTRGVRKSTKTNRDRTIPLTQNLQSMLLARRPANFNSENLVFPSPQGNAIDDSNFRSRAWKTMLTRLEIDYRRPYTTRHTLISHALDLGMNPVMVAELTGHDVSTLFRDYSGNVVSRPRLPDVLGFVADIEQYPTMPDSTQ